MSMREKLAELAHQQWSGWMAYMFSKCSATSAGERVIPEWAVQRWRRQVDTPYADLSENEQNSDREEADKFMAIFDKEIKQLQAENNLFESRLTRQGKNLRDAKAAIAKLKAETRWIPVGERLPEKDVDCLCFEGCFAGLGCYQRSSDTLQMQWQVNGFVSKRVTHWKPILLPIKE